MAEKDVKSTGVIEHMFSVGAHLGFSRSRRHPSVIPFIFGSKNRVEIFDLEKTQVLLEKAEAFLEDLGRKQKVILFVGGKHEARKIVKEKAEALGMPHVAGRWVGGTLTNFQNIKMRTDYLKDLLEKRERGEFATKYTKLERLMIDREIADLEKKYSGLLKLEALPHALFVVDTKYEESAVAEAKKMRIPIVGLCGSDCDVSEIEYPIVGNDSSVQSIAFFTEGAVKAYQKGLAEAVSKGGEHGNNN